MSRFKKLFSMTLALGLGAFARADDPAVVEIHATLAPLRSHPSCDADDCRGPWNKGDGDPRYSTPALTTAKRQLRDWIETRLASFAERGNEKALARKLNRELYRADLFCQRTNTPKSPDRCRFERADWNAIGFLYPDIRLTRPTDGVLVVISGMGIECDSDTSAYAYEWRGGTWQRFWQYEQAIEPAVHYLPQWIDSVEVSRADAAGARLVMTLGQMQWCQSTWYPMYARLWRAHQAGDAKLLLDLAEDAWINGDVEHPPVTGHVDLDDVYIGFARPGISDLVHTALLHFRVTGETLTRIDPLAPDPRAFVEEWLQSPWSDALRWAAQDALALADWHAKLRPEDYFSDVSDTLGCGKNSNVWQVSMQVSQGDKDMGSLYFRIGWRAPVRFEMLAIGTTEWPDCTGPEPRDNEFAPRPRRRS